MILRKVGKKAVRLGTLGLLLAKIIAFFVRIL